MSRAVAERFTQGDDDRCGARWPCQPSLRDVGRADIRWRRGNCVAPDLVRDRGPRGTSRSPMTGRESSSDDAARTRWCYLSTLPAWPGRSPLMRVSSATPGYLNPGTREGLARNRETRALRRRLKCSLLQAGANTRKAGVNAELSRGEATTGWCLRPRMERARKRLPVSRRRGPAPWQFEQGEVAFRAKSSTPEIRSIAVTRRDLFSAHPGRQNQADQSVQIKN
jgi:hypothetical protein